MSELASIRAALAAIAGENGNPAEDAAALACDALVRLDDHLERQRRSVSRLLRDVDEECIVKCEQIGEGAYELCAQLGVVEVSEYAFGDPQTQSVDTILENVRDGILDSLRVEIVRRRVAEATDRDLLDALDAAERGGDEEVGEIRAAAHDRGLRRI